jgi:hypothetical protein
MEEKQKNKIEIEGYEEITVDESTTLEYCQYIKLCDEEDNVLYFKKKEDWPKVFEGCYYNIKVEKNGNFRIGEKESDDTVNITSSITIKALKEAIKESDKIRSKLYTEDYY